MGFVDLQSTWNWWLCPLQAMGLFCHWRFIQQSVALPLVPPWLQCLVAGDGFGTWLWGLWWVPLPWAHSWFLSDVSVEPQPPLQRLLSRRGALSNMFLWSGAEIFYSVGFDMESKHVNIKAAFQRHLGFRSCSAALGSRAGFGVGGAVPGEWDCSE